MKLTNDSVRHIAQLAAIDLDDQELEKLGKQLNDILDYVEVLSSVNTKGVAPTSHVHGLTNAFRDDILGESLSVSEVEAIAPDFDRQGFRVPKVI